MHKKYFYLLVGAGLLISFWFGFYLVVKTKDLSKESLDYATLISSLRNCGLQVEEIDTTNDSVETSLFSNETKHLAVNGFPILVYEFENTLQAVKAGKKISNKGYQIGEVKLGWVEQPHFYQKDRLIVGYIGKISIILENLQQLLGEPLNH